jgi:prephenate dehydrogenase
MSKGQITIIGMDQVGTSLVLAIKRQFPNSVVVGADEDLQLLRDAMKLGKLDRNDSNLIVACREASLIIINQPPSQLREVFNQIGPHLSVGAVVLDLAAVKSEVLNAAEELLPATVRFLGCHLILHPDAADLYKLEPTPDLFHGSVLCMTPTAQTDEVAIKSGSDLARTIGARPYFMDVFEHDGLLAAVEGMPGLVSAALLLAATRSSSWSELSQIAGSIFAHATQPAAQPSIDGGSLTMNKADVLRWLDTFLATLTEVRRAVDAGDVDSLNALLNEATQQRLEWLAAKPLAPWNDQDALPGPPHELKRLDPLMPGWGQKT